MSGPVTSSDADVAEAIVSAPESGGDLEITPGREASVGGVPVHRVLPHRPRRTVGAWCFVDHFGPTDGPGMEIGPHPHIGLHTVTWLLSGELVHRDSLGSEQAIRPGQLNLMTAGAGIAHSEEAPPGWSGTTHGAQLWVAQPEGTRHGAPAFEHHGELPIVEAGAAITTVLVGVFDGVASSARHDSPLVGLDVQVRTGSSELPLDVGFEHAVVLLDGGLSVDGVAVPANTLVHLPVGRASATLTTAAYARLLVLGGEPFGEAVLMSWNFVGRTRDEIDAATDDWNTRADRFGVVDSSLDRIRAPHPPWR